ncbi:MAG: tetratricopeptide repeat protein [Gammaproteobacteria bacterium]
MRAGDASPTEPAVTAVVGTGASGQDHSPESEQIEHGDSPARSRNRGAMALEMQASSEYASGDHERAAATLERAIRMDPEDPGLWIALGEVRLAQGRPGLAESLGLKAVALSANDEPQTDKARRLVARARKDL